VAYAEKRGKTWRARWRAPDGTLMSRSAFPTRREAENYGRDQEAAIRSCSYVDPRAGQTMLTDWVNQWYPALDLELSTLSNYRYLLEVLILPTFGDRPLVSITPEQVSTWERQLEASGYSQRTARDARSTLITVLGDAVPRCISANPAVRKRGKGRKGQRRIQRIEHAEKAWATPLEALLVAERCAALSGSDADFVMVLTIAYTGMRWGETIGLRPECVHDDDLDIAWKLYELNGRFYCGRPKDGSIRRADLPPFLAELLGRYRDEGVRKCTCRGAEQPWCQGGEYVFLGPDSGHFRRSSYSWRFFRPAADGWYSAYRKAERRPVLVAADNAFPWQPLLPWPRAESGVPFVPPAGRGLLRLITDQTTGRCTACHRVLPRRLDGRVITHDAGRARCPGSGQRPAQDGALASWLPVLPGLTPHGLRHGHQTWMDEDRIAEVLKSERMGHEVPGMHGVYGHVTTGMRDELKAALEQRWTASLQEKRLYRLRPQFGPSMTCCGASDHN